MMQIGCMAAAAWLTAGLAGTGTVLAGMSEAPNQKTHIHDKLVAKQANAPPARAPHAKAPKVSEESARRIAWRSGVDHIEEIVLSGERWEVAGRDRTGNEKALDIHAYDGSVLY